LSRREHDAARTCLGCRRTRPRAELIRIARGPDETACFDVEGRLPGRGAWVCPAPACVDAISPGALGHVLRAAVRIPAGPERRALLAEALGRRAGNLLTMARRMRGVTLGPTGARSALAGDLPADTAASWASRAGSVPVAAAPAAAVLGALAGVAPIRVAAVTAEGLAAAIRVAFERWRAFSGIPCDNSNSDNQGASLEARGSATAGGGWGR